MILFFLIFPPRSGSSLFLIKPDLTIDREIKLERRILSGALYENNLILTFLEQPYVQLYALPALRLIEAELSSKLNQQAKICLFFL